VSASALGVLQTCVTWQKSPAHMVKETYPYGTHVMFVDRTWSAAHMHVWKYACVYTHACVCVCAFIQAERTHVHVFMYSFTHTACARTHAHVYVRACARAGVCVYMRLRYRESERERERERERDAYIHVCIHTYMCAYIHTDIPNSASDTSSSLMNEVTLSKSYPNPPHTNLVCQHPTP